MNPIIQFVLHSEALHFVLYVAFMAWVDTMPAPTKDSSVRYIWAFRWLNVFAIQFRRSKIPRVEDSPNFQDAVNIQTDIAGLPRIEVKKPQA